MMNRHFLKIISCLAFLLVLAVLGYYVSKFGIKPPEDRPSWGAFGDYFGGILNPIFALFAFLSVLWSISVQNKQASQSAIDKHADEILQVVKDIDSRLAALMLSTISPSSKNEEVILIQHMVAESERKGSILNKNDSYALFLNAARELGTFI